MTKWPDKARLAIRKLFEPLQDIDVYVEDEHDEAFYRELLNYASKGEVHIARVFAMRGRIPTIDAAKVHDHSLRRALFIVDGDLHWVKGNPLEHVAGLHCHEAYCVENLLLCEQAISTLLSHDLATTVIAAKQMLNYQSWLTEIREPLVQLFAAFATVNEFNPPVPTVSIGVGRLCSQTRSGATVLDISKVLCLHEQAIKKAMEVADKSLVDQRYLEIHSRLSKLPDPLCAVSGKDFLLPLLHFHLNTFECKIKTTSLRIRLACAGERNRFSDLANALHLTAIGAHDLVSKK